MIVYLAAPYTNGDVGQNIHNVIKIADKLVERGHTPYIPHLNHFWHLISPKDYKFWVEYDKVFLAKCDCLFRLAGFSEGADREVELALQLGMKVYWNTYDIP